jgi:hypothetical protein
LYLHFYFFSFLGCLHPSIVTTRFFPSRRAVSSLGEKIKKEELKDNQEKGRKEEESKKKREKIGP